MNSSERPEFDALFDQLCAALGGIATDAKREAFWKGLAKMSLVQFSRLCDHCLSEDGPDKLPSVPALWKLWRSMKAMAPGRARTDQPQPEVAQTKGLRAVNALFLKYLMRRRIVEGVKFDIDVRSRRRECVSLANWLDDAMAEGLPPDDDELQAMFDKAMARVPDVLPEAISSQDDVGEVF